MRYLYSDGEKSFSKRPKQKSDCVIRAIATVEGLPYDTAYDIMAKMGRKCSRGTPKKIWQKYLNENERFVRISFPAQKGKARMNLERFAFQFNEGWFVVQCAGHLTVVINGFVYDIFEPRKDACVYAAWKRI